MNASSIPRGLYGSGADGLGDEDRPSTAERLTRSADRLADERARARSASPFLARLRRAALRVAAPTRGLGR